MTRIYDLGKVMGGRLIAVQPFDKFLIHFNTFSSTEYKNADYFDSAVLA